jgi:hypothetical protein
MSGRQQEQSLEQVEPCVVEDKNKIPEKNYPDSGRMLI